MSKQSKQNPNQQSNTSPTKIDASNMNFHSIATHLGGGNGNVSPQEHTTQHPRVISPTSITDPLLSRNNDDSDDEEMQELQHDPQMLLTYDNGRVVDNGRNSKRSRSSNNAQSSFLIFNYIGNGPSHMFGHTITLQDGMKLFYYSQDSNEMQTLMLPRIADLLLSEMPCDEILKMGGKL